MGEPTSHGDVREGAQAAAGRVQVLVRQEGRDGAGGEDGVDQQLVGQQGRSVQVPRLGQVPAGGVDPGLVERDPRTPAAAAQCADHQRAHPGPGCPEFGLQRLLGGRQQRRRQPAPVLEHGEGGPQISGPVAEGRQPPPLVVRQVLQVQQRPAPGDEAAQQLGRARLALVGVPEVDVPVAQLARLVREFLEADDHRVRWRADPGPGVGDAAADRLVLIDREDPLRGLLDGQAHSLLDEPPGVGRDDGRAAFGRTGLVAQPQVELGHTRLTSGRRASAAKRPALKGLMSTKGTRPR